MLRKLSVFVALLVLAAAFVGAQAKPVIRFATGYLEGNGFEKTTFDKDVYAFADSWKDKATFKFEISKGDDLRTKIKTDLAADNLPDIFTYWTRGSIRDMVDAGKLLEIHDYLKVSKNIKWTDFPVDGWKAYSFDDAKTVYGFPIEGSTAYFLVNKKIFAKYNLKYPKTEADLLLKTIPSQMIASIQNSMKTVTSH
jgi:raffinose/stachyose/melibiose transport system substrate-binding protein